MTEEYSDYILATRAFKRNERYRVDVPFEKSNVSGSVKKIPEVKYYYTVRDENRGVRKTYHVFGNPDGPDMVGNTAPPQSAIVLKVDDMFITRPRKHTLTPSKEINMARATEVGIATGTRVEGPAPKTGKAPRKEAELILPRDVTRNIASYLGGKGRRRKTRRTRRS
jgi:hypothetical protein